MQPARISLGHTLSPNLPTPAPALVEAARGVILTAALLRPQSVQLDAVGLALAAETPDQRPDPAAWAHALAGLLREGSVTCAWTHSFGIARAPKADTTVEAISLGLARAEARRQAALALAHPARVLRVATAIPVPYAERFTGADHGAHSAHHMALAWVMRFAVSGDPARFMAHTELVDIVEELPPDALVGILAQLPPAWRTNAADTLGLCPLTGADPSIAAGLRKVWGTEGGWDVHSAWTSDPPPALRHGGGAAGLWATLCTGDLPGAIAAALTLCDARGGRNSSLGTMPATEALPCLLALGLAPDAPTRRVAHRLHARLASGTAYPVAWGSTAGPAVVPPTHDLVSVREGAPLPSRPPRPPGDMLAELIAALAVHFAGAEPDADRLEWLARKAETCEAPRLADTLRALDPRTPGPRPPLLGLWTPPPRWAQRLGALAAQLGIGAADLAQARLVWSLDIDALLRLDSRAVVPRVQVPDRAGRFSSGRVVKIAALRAGKVREATPQDRLIADALLPSGVVAPDEPPPPLRPATLAALCGHPLLLDSAGQPVRMRLIHPGLNVQPVDNGVLIAPTHSTDLAPARLVAPGLVEVVADAAAETELVRRVGTGFVVPTDAIPELTRVLSHLAHRLPVHDYAGLLSTRAAGPALPGDARPVLQLRPAGIGVAVRVGVRPAGMLGPVLSPGIGANELHLEVNGVAQRVRRRLDDEQSRLVALVEHLPFLDGLPPGRECTLNDPFATFALLEVVANTGESISVEWVEGRPLRLRGRLTPAALRIHTRAVGGWLSLDGHLALPDGEQLALGAVLDALRLSGQRFVPLDGDDFVVLGEELLSRMMDIVRVRAPASAGAGVRVHPLAAGALVALREGSLDAEVQTKLDALHAQGDGPLPLPEALATRLRPYQVDGVRWLHRLSTLGIGALLADDMGVGKTLQTLCVLQLRAQEGPALVLAPASVVGGWVDQATRFTPTLQVVRLDDLPADRIPGPGTLVVCSYGLLPHHGARLTRQRWATLIIDEAQAIKNEHTQRHQLVAGLDAAARVALTGTPVENHLGELWALSEVLNPGLLGTAADFRSRFATPIADGDSAARDQLRALLLPLVLRRTKAAVLADLPARTEVDLPLRLGAEERLAYQQLRTQLLADIAAAPRQTMLVLRALTQLRRAACHPSLVDPALRALPSAKMEALADLVDTLAGTDHRALIFSQYTDHLDRAEALLRTRGLAHLRLDGSVPSRQRDERVQAFQNGAASFFLISLRAGGAGLNLTAADVIIHLDPWWNPAVEDQASDRAHRIGQTRPVTIYRLIAQDTVEESILRLHGAKRALADALLADAATAGSLTVDELLLLMRGTVATEG